jgi:hypothetical protein
MENMSHHNIRFEQIFNEQNFITACIITIIFLSLLHFGQPASINLDPSWTLGLGYAFAHNFQAGVDYVFTFAPLGYYQHSYSSYMPSLFATFIIWQSLTALIIAILMTMSLRLIPSHVDKFLYILLFLTVSSGWHLESIYFTVLNIALIFAIRLLENQVITWKIYVGLVALLLLIILIGLGKFAFFVWMVVAVIGLASVTTVQHSWRMAVILLLTYILLFIAVWLALGQQIVNIPLFILNSLEITRGYSEAMSTLYFPTQLFYAALIFGAFLMLMALSIFTQPFKLSKLIVLGAVSLTLLLTFKGGFVRQGLHVLIFFPTALVLPFLIGYDIRNSVIIKLIQSVLRYAIVFFALYGTLLTGGFGIPHSAENFLGFWNKRIVNNTYELFHLAKLQQTYETQWATLKQQYDLPKMRAAIGQETVDIFSWEQSVIFLNDFNWHPRPVFQSYTVYTAKLMEINRQFFLTRPPKFVILKLQAIDFQLPLANDAESYKILLQDYQPVLEENGYLLLAHAPIKRDAVSPHVLLHTRIKEGEWLDISEFNQLPLLLALDIKKSWLGKAYVAAYRLPEIYLETRVVEGNSLRHRLIPQMAETGFLYNPLILTQADVSKWYTHQPLQHVQALRIVIQPAWLQQLFQADFGVQLTEFDANKKLN